MEHSTGILTIALVAVLALAYGCERGPEPSRPQQESQQPAATTVQSAPPEPDTWEPGREDVRELVKKFCQVPATTNGVNQAFRAVSRIAEGTGDENLTKYAERMKGAAVYIAYTIDPPVNVRLAYETRKKHFSDAIAFLRQYPELGVNLIRRFDEVSWGCFGGHAFMELVRQTWHDSYIPALEELVKTSTYTCPYEGDHYFLRRDAAALLASKTGTEYTYIDMDGQVHRVSKSSR